MDMPRRAIQWTPRIYERIESAILNGQSVESILSELRISDNVYYRQRLKDPAFDASIVRAQEISQEREVDYMLKLADSATEENVNAIKLRIWTRQWIAGRRARKKYGDRVEQEHTGSVGLQLVHDVPRPERVPRGTDEPPLIEGK